MDSGFARYRPRPGMTEAIQPTLRRPYSLRRGVRRLPFFLPHKSEGMERREGARGLRGPFGQPLRSGRPRALRGRAPVCETGCAPLALHLAARIVGAPRLVVFTTSLEMTPRSQLGAHTINAVQHCGDKFFSDSFSRVSPMQQGA